jgi:hypothetical protein
VEPYLQIEEVLNGRSNIQKSFCLKEIRKRTLGVNGRGHFWSWE